MGNLIAQRTKTSSAGLVNELNDSAILQVLDQRTVISQLELADVLGLSRPSISRHVRRLLTQSLIEIAGYGDAARTGGRRPRLLRLTRGRGAFLGVDIGSAHLRAVLTDLDHRILTRMAINIGHSSDRSTMERRLIALVKDMIGDTQIKGICVAVPGVVDATTGHVAFSANAPWLRGLRMVELLENVSKVPIYLINATDAKLLGETYFDAELVGKQVMSVVCGIGIGVNAVVHDAELISSARQRAWDIGHITIERGGHPCGCTRRGCLEAYASGWAIARDAREAGLESWDHVTAESVNTLAEAGHSEAISILSRAGETLGSALAPFIQFFAPDAIIFSGGVCSGSRIFTDSIMVGILKRIEESEMEGKIVRKTKLDEFGAALGATKVVANRVLRAPLLKLAQSYASPQVQFSNSDP